MINDAFETIDSDTYEMLVAYFDRFGKAVREAAGSRARQKLAEFDMPVPNSVPLEKVALDFLVNSDLITCVSVDMEGDDHVMDMLAAQPLPQ